MIHFSRPETNEEVFQIFGSEENMVELGKIVARMLPHSSTLQAHTGRWSHDLKPIGRVDENLVARLNRDALEELGLTDKGPENGLDN